jgi:co-chaperonin GroES (HSP10)
MTTSNNSGLEPRGHAVLVKPYEPDFQSSIIAIPDSYGDRNKMAENRAIIVAVGNAAWDEEPEHRAVPGDKVLITRYAGVMARGPADGEIYRLINDRDVYCRITSEENPNVR